MNKKFIVIILFTIFFLPIKTFGYFAMPDEYTNSMSFGGQNNDESIQKLSTPSNLILNDNENLNNNEQNKIINNPEKIINDISNLSVVKYVTSTSISNKYYLFWSVVFIIFIFIIIISIFYTKKIKF
jgi:predicted PurR-regulated permease PerM